MGTPHRRHGTFTLEQPTATLSKLSGDKDSDGAGPSPTQCPFLHCGAGSSDIHYCD
jgi:hypothetical protein